MVFSISNIIPLFQKYVKTKFGDQLSIKEKVSIVAVTIICFCTLYKLSKKWNKLAKPISRATLRSYLKMYFISKKITFLNSILQQVKHSDNYNSFNQPVLEGNVVGKILFYTPQIDITRNILKRAHFILTIEGDLKISKKCLFSGQGKMRFRDRVYEGSFRHGKLFTGKFLGLIEGSKYEIQKEEGKVTKIQKLKENRDPEMLNVEMENDLHWASENYHWAFFFGHGPQLYFQGKIHGKMSHGDMIEEFDGQREIIKIL